MVRCGTLPLRLLALRYGCDTVYSEEIVDKRLIQCRRIENKKLGTIDFVTGQPGNTQLIFRTLRSEEQGKCVFQIGTATPDLAVQAARIVANDVDGLDVNMGCPKHFSVHSGMGVALTRDNDRACSIIRALCGASLGIPVSCKIRLRDTIDETVQLVRDLEAAGAQAIGVHARTASERPKDTPHWDQLKQIVDAVTVPIIVNGDIWGPAEVQHVRALSGCSSVMSARGALKNLKLCFEKDINVYQKESSTSPIESSAKRTIAETIAERSAQSNTESSTQSNTEPSTKSSATSSATSNTESDTTKLSTKFNTETYPSPAIRSIMHVIKDYVKVCIDYDNHGKNTKYVVQYMLKMNSILGTPFGTSISSKHCRTLQDVATICGLETYYNTVQQNRPHVDVDIEEEGEEKGIVTEGGQMKPSREYDDNFFYARAKKRRKMANEPDQKLPPDFKLILLQWGNLQTELKRKLQVPQYQHIDRTKAYPHIPGVVETSQAQAYKAAVHVVGRKFIGGWGASKAIATSKAAHVAIIELGIDII